MAVPEAIPAAIPEVTPAATPEATPADPVQELQSPRAAAPAVLPVTLQRMPPKTAAVPPKAAAVPPRTAAPPRVHQMTPENLP